MESLALKVYNQKSKTRVEDSEKEYTILSSLKGHPNIVEVYNHYNGTGCYSLPQAKENGVENDLKIEN